MAIDIYIDPYSNPGAVSVKKAVLVSDSYLQVKMSHQGDASIKTYGFDLSHFIPEIDFTTSKHPEFISRLFSNPFAEGVLSVSLLWGVSGKSPGVLRQYPHYFCLAKGEKETADKADIVYYAPNRETGQELYARLMPYLHASAKSFVDAVHHAMPHLTGNARKILQAVRDTASNNRFENSVNRFRLPIGYAARELYRHSTGKPTLKPQEIELLVKDIHAVLTRPGSWWAHHSRHDVAYWNKHHTARRVLLDKPDGTIEHIYDIDANLVKTLDKNLASDAKVVAARGEREFSELATRWFSDALYTEHREFIKTRKLTFQEKKD